MNGEQVVYSMSLQDMLSPKIREAEGHVTQFEGKMKGLTGVVAEFGKGMLAGFATFGAFNFLKDSLGDFNNSAQAAAQLNASLESTGAIAWANKTALDGQAESLMKTTLFDDDDITKAQGILLTFTDIRGAIYDQAVPAITDLAAKMGGDLQGATVQVGKALNDPIQGINALRRVGVSFSESQRDVIKSLVETGNKAEAQKMILAELNKEFGGSAAAAAAAGTGWLTVLGHEFGNVREDIGELISKGLIALKPAIEGVIEGIRGFVHWLKDAYHWIKENQEVVTTILIGLGAYLLVTQGLAMWTGIVSAATSVWTGIQWLLNAALTANPIGIVIMAITALVAGIIYAYEHCAKFRGYVLGVWEAFKELGNYLVNVFGGTLKGLGEMIEGVFEFDADKIGAGFDTAAKAWEDGGKRLKDAFQRGFAEGIQPLTPDSGPVAAAANLSGRKPATELSGDTTKTKPTGVQKVSGQKVLHINITIGSLIKENKNIITNVSQQGMKNLKDTITRTLLEGVNDFQLIAE